MERIIANIKRKVQAKGKDFKEKLQGIKIRELENYLAGTMEIYPKEERYSLDVAMKGKLQTYCGVTGNSENYEEYNPMISDCRLTFTPDLKALSHPFPIKDKVKPKEFFYENGKFKESVILHGCTQYGSSVTIYREPPSEEILKKAEPLIKAMEFKLGRILVERGKDLKWKI